MMGVNKTCRTWQTVVWINGLDTAYTGQTPSSLERYLGLYKT